MLNPLKEKSIFEHYHYHMDKLLVLSFTLLILHSAAQTDKSILPHSFESNYNSNEVPELRLPPFRYDEVTALDADDLKKGEMPKFSRSISTDVNMRTHGKWTNLPGGDRMWQLKITSEGAQALLPYYNEFYIPEGASFHVMDETKTEIIGAFTHKNNSPTGYYATGLIHGESCILEYFEPKSVIGKGRISLNEVGHAYRWVNSYFPDNRGGSALGFNQSDNCEVNVNCSEGNDWQDQKRSVVCIIVQSQFGQGVCSGAMINNVREDCTPYLLSAQHCSEDVNSSHYPQWIFYFNYESPDCNTPSVVGTMDDNFVVGCVKKADSNDNGGDTGSDFLLVELNEQPPANFNIYYAGWSAATNAPSNGVCIHHPEGDIKKISSFQQTGVNTSWGGSNPGTHWRIKWVISTNGHGVTEPGSSGSPLFNSNKLIVGKLTGGDSFCNTPNSPDFFGKLSYDWTDNGTTAAEQLKPWLDPDNTGTTAITGRNADCTTGLSDLNSIVPFLISPNPANNFFSITRYTDSVAKLEVFDLSGRCLFVQYLNKKTESFSVSNFNPGLYLIKLDNYITKLIVE